jgi:hypothetical protein
VYAASSNLQVSATANARLHAVNSASRRAVSDAARWWIGQNPRRFDHTWHRIVGDTFGNYSNAPSMRRAGLGQAPGLRASSGLARPLAWPAQGAKHLTADRT